MYMLIINFILLTFITFFCMLHIHHNRIQLKNSAKHLHIIVMALCLMSSLSFGITIGLLFGHDLVWSTLIASFIGISIGYLVGKDFEALCILCGTIEGIMGGMMGAMTGMMVFHQSNFYFLILFFDLLFVLVALTIFLSLKKLSKHVKSI
ncbi:putative CDP-diglyceride synthetase [Bacillus sp. TS-2]|nr:putative CDP-diglyceride synthetase [Bacillus sp. TS-2]